MTDIESLLNAYETRKAARDAALRSKKLVLVEWLDSHHRAGWTTEPPATTALTCLSVGWLTCDGDEAKTLTPHLTIEDTPQRSGEMTIPSRAIVRMEVLNNGTCALFQSVTSVACVP